MKKIVLLIVLLLCFAGLHAQEVDLKELQAFIGELESLKSEHVEVDNVITDDIVRDLSSYGVARGGNIDILELLGDLEKRECSEIVSSTKKAYKLIEVLSVDEIGYNAMREIIDRYDVTESEDLFGIPLAASHCEYSDSQMIFIGQGHTLCVCDEGDELTFFYH